MLTVDRRFRWVWAAYAVSAYGTWLGFGAFPLIAVLVLDVGPAQVSALSAAGLAVGAVVAVPLGPWVEFRGKRQVMVAADLIRFAALASVPVAFVFGWLTFVQLVVVSVVAAAAKIAFNAASGAYLKGLLSPPELLVANGRLESTMWSASVVGPPLGGAAIGVFGPVVTVLADAVSYLVSALCVRAIGGGEPPPARRPARLRPTDLLDGWREILAHRALRRLFCTTVLFNGLLLATEPLLAVLLLDRLGFTPWQYGLVFALPCLGGLAGARLARRLVARFGQSRVLRAAGVLRTCWPVWLAFVQPGVPGIVLVIVVQFGLVFCCAVFAPVLATYRLERITPDRVARTLTAWSVTGSLAIAALTAIWGLLAAVIGPREAVAVAGVLILFTGLSGKP
ncbi:MFS transporter [Herbidospora sp. NEAU-GS84]|uniref:MFS transporter n=1 Tax=Herbidospora solisilvae TaxID=2696284 RepID=A0A7C9P2N8_9ACTN|nr:MFS transporter [Herbidospora solisilvae]NAS26637.1 MFS transporter [Herbidospora solisilvae]